MPLLRLYSYSPDDHLPLVKQMMEACKAVRIFAFYGDLGAGKTTLIKSFCRFWGVLDSVTSPTFTLVNTYQTDNGVIHHFDFYRIEREEEADDIGVDEYFDSGQYVLIEWPERIPTLLPVEAAKIRIAITDGQTRQIDLSY